MLTEPSQSEVVASLSGKIAALKATIAAMSAQLCKVHAAADRGPGGCIACTLESRAERAEEKLTFLRNAAP
jgi:hypothetical protein